MKTKTINLLLRISLFTITLGLGTAITLAAGETTSLALTDLSNAPIETIAKTASGDLLYATLSGKNHGLYRSDDYGRSWRKVSQGPGRIINNLAINPMNDQQLYASTIDETTGSGDLWYSNDGGQTWKSADLELSASSESQLSAINVLAISPDDPSILYVGTEGNGLFRARFEAERYEQMGDSAMQRLRVRDIVVDPSGLLYIVATEGMFIIDDNAFHKIESLPDVAVSLAIDPSDSDRLFAGTVAYGVYVSEDGGHTWQTLNAGLGWQSGIILKIPAIVVDEHNPRHLALTTAYGVGSHWLGDGVYESFNAGQHWVKIARRDDIVEQLMMVKGTIYAATQQEGLSRYGDPLPSGMLSYLSFQSLADPTGSQILIMGLTITLAGWTLLGHGTWVSPLDQQEI